MEYSLNFHHHRQQIKYQFDHYLNFVKEADFLDRFHYNMKNYIYFFYSLFQYYYIQKQNCSFFHLLGTQPGFSYLPL